MADYTLIYKISLKLKQYRRLLFNNLLLGGKGKLDIDYTATISGLSGIYFGGSIYAGKHLWLGAYNLQDGEYRIVFKGNFHASDFCHIGANNHVEIGNNVLFGSKVYVTDHEHGCYTGECQSSPEIPPIERPLTNDKAVFIGDNVWLGDNVVVLPGVTIGNGTIVGANAVVTKSLPPNCIAVGVPAKVIKIYDFCSKTWCET